MDLIRDIYGADRGFNVAADIVTQTAGGVPLNDIYTELVHALNEWKKNRNLVTRLLTFDTTDSFDQIAGEPGKGSDFEVESEFDVPKSSRRDVNWLRMGYPLEFWDAASRFTHKFLRDSSADQFRLQFEDKIEQHNRLLFRKTMEALTDRPATIGDRDANENGVSIYGLWTVSPTPSHRCTQVRNSRRATTSTWSPELRLGDLKALISTIQKHGHGLPESANAS